ncbi:MAG: IS21 family transposase [Bacillota bacterium]|nr:IS21 family transposase [Bacillota bacterium]
MSNNLKIVQSVYSGLSQREVARQLRVGRNRVARLVSYARSQGWFTPEDLDPLDEASFSAALPEKQSALRDTGIHMPNYEEIHERLAGVHVTLKLLWEEYVAECQAEGRRFYQLTQFRRYYHEFAKSTKATLRLEHKPGMAMQVDWAGTRIPYGDPEAGALKKASLFVAVLPCSRLIYAEPFPSEKLASWIRGHVNAFAYMGGAPKTIVSDNLKAGVTKPDRYEPVINRSYDEMAAHYGSVVLPARVARPRDRGSGENAVRIAARTVIAKLRRTTAYSFSELHQRVAEKLELVNEALMTEGNVSRWTSYLKEEKEYMLTLPASPYELASWKKAKAQVNCHVAFDKRFYSIPYEYIRKTVDVRSTDHTVEIFYHHERIASHIREHGRRVYITVREHLPPEKLFYTDWDRGRFLNWAGKIGPSTRAVIQSFFDQAPIEQHAYRRCFGLLALAQSYSKRMLESACRRVLDLTRSPSYRMVKDLLKQDEKKRRKDTEDAAAEKQQTTRGFTRGKKYYGGIT